MTTRATFSVPIAIRTRRAADSIIRTRYPSVTGPFHKNQHYHPSSIGSTKTYREQPRVPAPVISAVEEEVVVDVEVEVVEDSEVDVVRVRVRVDVDVESRSALETTSVSSLSLRPPLGRRQLRRPVRTFRTHCAPSLHCRWWLMSAASITIWRGAATPPTTGRLTQPPPRQHSPPTGHDRLLGQQIRRVRSMQPEFSQQA